MSGDHARPTTGGLFRSAPAPGPARGPAPEACPAHAATRRRAFGRRLRRRILAYRGIEFLTSHIPGEPGPGEECLLLVHTRKVVGQVHYRLCDVCAEGVITGVDIDAPFRSTGLGTRALSHLRSRHPGIAWRSTLTLRTTRDLLRRMRIPTAGPGPVCTHARSASGGGAVAGPATGSAVR